MMQTSDVARWLGIAPVTVRQWSAGEWGQYLSPGGQGGAGRTRTFNEQDARIIAHIARLKASGQDRDSIHATLKTMQAASWDGLPDMPIAPPDFEPIAVIPTSTAVARVDAVTRQKELEVIFLEEKIGRLETELKTAIADKAALQTELTAAREQIGELRGQMSERKPTDYWIGRIDNERRRWLWVIGLAVLVAILMTAILLFPARGF